MMTVKPSSVAVESQSRDSTSQHFFEQKYRTKADFWSFASNPYEQARYDSIVRALEHRRYARAFEPGCSIGVLTQRLAALCDNVDAMDIAPNAVQQAQERCRALAQVRIVCGALSELPFSGNFDLLVLSEIGYYFEAEDLRRLGRKLVSSLVPTGVMLAAHWLGSSEDHRLSGDRVHEVLRSLDGLALEHSEQHAGFRLDRWVRN